MCDILFVMLKDSGTGVMCREFLIFYTATDRSYSIAYSNRLIQFGSSQWVCMRNTSDLCRPFTKQMPRNYTLNHVVDKWIQVKATIELHHHHHHQQDE